MPSSRITHHVLVSRAQPAPRVAASEVFELARTDRPANVRHQALVEPNIMQRNEDRAKHLAREKKVSDRPTGKRAARITVAAGLDRAGVAGELAVAQANRAG